ncbi:MAG TPA: response regulator transcription factor [Bryobacteraceae bacterium]|nr:response regulator transcription factor [Bryobacteraceae bacterium]
MRLIIADDDPGIRYILRSIVEGFGAEVLAEAENGHHAIQQTALHKPQLILLDVSMPEMGGFPALKYLRKAYPELRILMVSEYSQNAYVREALRLGANGYLVKSYCASELRPAIQAIMAGRTFVSAPVANYQSTANGAM